MSRSLLLGILGTLIVISGLSVFFYYYYIKTAERPLHEAIPGDALFFVESENAKTVLAELQESEWFQELSNNQEWLSATASLMELDTLVSQSDLLTKLLENQPCAISFYNQSASPDWMLTFRFDEWDRWQMEIKSVLQAHQLVLSQRSIERVPVYDVYRKGGENILSFAWHDGFLWVSRKGILVEKGVRKLKYNLSPFKGIEQVYNMYSGKQDVTLYMNYASIHAGQSVLFSNDSLWDKHHSAYFAKWTALQVEFSKNTIEFTGATTTDDSIYQFLDIMNGQQPVAVDPIYAYLPENTAYFKHIGISDITSYVSDLQEYLSFHNLTDSMTVYRNQVMQSTGVDLNRMATMLGQNHVYFLATPQGKAAPVEAILHLAPDAQSLQEIVSRLATASANAMDSINPYISYKGYSIYHLPVGDMHRYLLGPYFSGISNPYVCVLNNYVVAGADASIVMHVIEQQESGKVLSQSSGFMQSVQTQKRYSNVSFYIQTELAYTLPFQYYNSTCLSIANRYSTLAKKLTHVHMQFATANDRTFYTHVSLSYNKLFEEQTKDLWSVKLDTTAIIAPQACELFDSIPFCIFVQDARNQCYLFDATGNQLWKIKLNEPVISNVTVAALKPEHKPVLMFNTSSALYAIQPNGTNRYGYPIRLPGKTKYAAKITDWYADSTFEWYVRLSNNRVLGYQANARLIAAWSAFKLSDTLGTDISIVSTPSVRLLAIPDNGAFSYYSPAGKKADSTLLSKTGLRTICITQNGNQHGIWAFENRTGYIYPFDSTGKVSEKVPYINDADSLLILSEERLIRVKQAENWTTYSWSGLQLSNKTTSLPFTTHMRYCADFGRSGALYGTDTNTHTAYLWSLEKQSMHPDFPMNDIQFLTLHTYASTQKNYAIAVGLNNILTLIQLK